MSNDAKVAKVAKTPKVAKADGEMSDTEKKLREEFKENPNAVLRKVNEVYARKLLNKPNMSWEEFCDMKIKAHTDHWTEKKKNPEAGKSPRLISADKIQKEEDNLAKIEARAKALRERLAKSKKVASK